MKFIKFEIRPTITIDEYLLMTERLEERVVNHNNAVTLGAQFLATN